MWQVNARIPLGTGNSSFTGKVKLEKTLTGMFIVSWTQWSGSWVPAAATGGHLLAKSSVPWGQPQLQSPVPPGNSPSKLGSLLVVDRKTWPSRPHLGHILIPELRPTKAFTQPALQPSITIYYMIKTSPIFPLFKSPISFVAVLHV